MEKQMYESMMAIKVKYAELQNLLQQPEVLSDIKKYTRITKEANSIKLVSESFDKYLILEKGLKEAKEMLVSENDEEMIEMAKAEIQSAESQMPALQEELKILLLPQDPNDDKNVIIEIRGAAGGDEANIFAGDLFDIYKRWCAQNSMKLELLETTKGEAGGFSQLVFRVSGEKAYSKLKFESGVHRVQRVPATETMGRVHTSTATVTVMPEADESVDIEIKMTDVKIDTFRSSGAGGQSVNTTDSAVRLTHIPTGIVISSQDGRSQIANRETAFTLLKTKLYDLEVQKQQQESATYRALAGSGARAEKIRTYNYPQDRVTDHRIGFSASLKTVETGKLDSIIEALLAAEQAEKIKEAGI